MPEDPYASFFTEREAAPAAHRRSDAAWARVREDYLAGASAPQLAERHGVSVSALRARARAEGWRRSDAPDAPPPEDTDDEALLAEAGAASPAELRPLAWARAALAVRRGRLQEALGWTRLVRQLDRMAEAQAASPALQARAADSLARAADTLAAARRSLARPTPPDRHDALILPCGEAAGEGDQAQPAGGGRPELHARSVDAPSVGLPAATSPAAPPQGRKKLHDLHEVHDALILPCGEAAGEGDQAQPGGGGRPELYARSVEAPSVGLTAATSPAAAPQERKELHDLHDLILPCGEAAGEGDQAQPGEGGRPERDARSVDAPSAGLPTATSPAAPPQERREMHDLHGVSAAASPPPAPPRQYGPVVPPIPPEWVRWRLHAR